MSRIAWEAYLGTGAALLVFGIPMFVFSALIEFQTSWVNSGFPGLGTYMVLGAALVVVGSYCTLRAQWLYAAEQRARRGPTAGTTTGP